MAIRGQALNVYLTVWNTSDNAPQANDAGNLTLGLCADGATTSSTPTNSAADTDLTGIVKLALTAAEMDCDSIVVGGSSSTADCEVIPVAVVTESGRLDAAVTSREADGAAAAAVATLNDPTPADIWTHTPRTVTGIAPGVDDRVVTLTLEDGAGNPVPGIRTLLYFGGSLAAAGATGGTGQFACLLPDENYEVLYGPSPLYSFSNPYALTVDGDTAATHECEALSIPASISPDTCACYLYMQNISGVVLGENDGWLEVLAIEDPVWPLELDSGGVALARTGTKSYTDATGLVQITLVRGSRVRLRIGGVADRYNRGEVTFTVPEAATYNIATTS